MPKAIFGLRKGHFIVSVRDTVLPTDTGCGTQIQAPCRTSLTAHLEQIYLIIKKIHHKFPS